MQANEALKFNLVGGNGCAGCQERIRVAQSLKYLKGKIIIDSKRTARDFSRISPNVMKFYKEYIRNSQNPRILDWGAGKLRHARFLSSKGYVVTVWDPNFLEEYQQLKDPRIRLYNPHENGQFSHILCIYVLNVLCCQAMRRQVIQDIKKNTSVNGKILIEVRGKYAMESNKTKIPYKGGYLMRYGKGIRTFQKGFTKQELIMLCMECNLEVEKIYEANLKRAIAIVFSKGR